MPPVYEYRKTGYSLSGRVERNTRFYRTDFAPLPWGSRQATVTVTPRNNYTDVARLEVENNVSVRAELGHRELRLGSPAQTTLTLRPYMHAGGSPLYRIPIRAHDATGRLVETAGYDLNLHSSRPVGFATHRTVYRNAWDPVAPLPPPPPPSPPPPQIQPTATLFFHAFPSTSRLTVWGRPTTISGNFNYFKQYPSKFKFHLSGIGEWEGGGSGTVSVEVVTAGEAGGHVYTGSATIRSGVGRGFVLEPVINPQIFLPPNPFAGGFFDAQEMRIYTHRFKATATLSAPNGVTVTSVRFFNVEVWIHNR
jgi:hypothetical protein